MTGDKQTIDVYESRASDYAKLVSFEDTPGLDLFIQYSEPGGYVLDLGCGPGHAALRMQNGGLRVDALDASAAMVAAARERGVNARQASFDEINGEDVYDGIWANFSLLHATRAAFPFHLMALKRAMKPGGLLHIGMKLGEGEARDALGRFYTYYDEDDLVRHLTMTGFAPAARFRGKGRGLDGSVTPWIWIHAHG